MFESLLDSLINNLKNINAQELKIYEEFQEYSSTENNYVIKNWLFKSSKFRKWRITRLDGGDKIQVFNTVAYPIFSCEQPLLGADILWFGNSNKTLAVFDYQPLIQDKKYLEEYCSSLNSIKKQYVEFDNTKMKNIYDSNKYFSPWVIISRRQNLNDDKDLYGVFNSFLREYLIINKDSCKNKFLNSKQIQKKHIQYDKYSIEKDPAEKLFKKFFGDTWTKKFIKNFLFTLS